MGGETHGQDWLSERTRYGHRDFDDLTNNQGKGIFQREPKTTSGSSTRNQNISSSCQLLLELSGGGEADWRGETQYLVCGFGL